MLWWEISILVAAALVLVAMLSIDIREQRLPDGLNAAFAVLGLTFHFVHQPPLASWSELVAGAICGTVLLYALRAYFLWRQRLEGLGLGDVKYMAAAGLWVGIDFIFLVILAGALLSLAGIAVHSLFRRQQLAALKSRRIPFGPGLILATVSIFSFALWAGPIYP